MFSITLRKNRAEMITHDIKMNKIFQNMKKKAKVMKKTCGTMHPNMKKNEIT